MSADRHLLFGLLALQNEFIDRRQLVAAFGIWIADQGKSLDEILVDQKVLSDDDRAVLARLVDRHVAARGGDIAASLRALSSIHSVRNELSQLANEDVQASIAKLEPDNIATVVPSSMGESTTFWGTISNTSASR